MLLSAALAAVPPEPPPEPPPAAEPPAPAEPPASRPNVPLPTFGGMQVWGDVAHRAGWRVQRNVLTGHHRLLDPADVRRAWGDLAACEAALAAAVEEHALPRPAGETVILVHGMVRSGRCFAALAADLQAAGFRTVAVTYPSTRQSLRESAAMLTQIADRLVAEQDPADPITLHFVGHSAGGLVIRAWGEANPHAPFGRTVLMGVPNGGAAMADAVRGVPLLGSSLDLAWGSAAGELSTDPAASLRTLPPPPGEFLTVAGCRGTAAGYNPLIPGDDDGTVGVSEAQLAGQTEHLAVPGALHSFLMNEPAVRAATVRFLRDGRASGEGAGSPGAAE